jgi:hypothetical protein
LKIFPGGEIRDRCYAFKNIFAEKFGENIGVFRSNYSWFFQKFDHWFLDKLQFFRLNLAKIA